jgi:hypothetical protein
VEFCWFWLNIFFCNCSFVDAIDGNLSLWLVSSWDVRTWCSTQHIVPCLFSFSEKTGFNFLWMKNVNEIISFWFAMGKRNKKQNNKKGKGQNNSESDIQNVEGKLGRTRLIINIFSFRIYMFKQPYTFLHGEYVHWFLVIFISVCISLYCKSYISICCYILHGWIIYYHPPPPQATPGDL